MSRTPKITQLTADGECAARVVRQVRGGPTLVEGPVRIVEDDGAETVSDRFVVAVCRCHRSALYPLCDTSHRTLRAPKAASTETPKAAASTDT
ncbi:CDGSH iron-sulfur domain-containing protein [Rhodococcus rhodochrous]|uniref:CDGSH iron-sulfur domain-containing protein n=1 Tax=Rhodococcus rhodochrous TaxID=1829 RepID=UPI001E30E965|nr:CDGSH iron-sulfur domain-containing protein [Rhodococcus rhodochrous]MCD2097147.1 CDGSH iron-sulfur domain-containing protein [Rhodococcus rhodochrous]MCD2120421.1 CDGSH iron-sulfur domain-containing protein [Rhodococcus rhodochrous]MCQ4133107.1 CDGSH iron-sulfur domain-containing protein [Rhodococcus rhodochrous]MDJ0017286.1 CDGSH iron-sulfur domain-containing protein [Rhodococcus rhodochrous]